MNKQCIMHQFTPLAQEANFDRKVRILIELYVMRGRRALQQRSGKTCKAVRAGVKFRKILLSLQS